ncbi:hypothetical protein BGX21_002862 [Mortierella sp. AD011]|nr:hypothetical protein BGX20_007788 [Mortierella sp. AD010]KAF9401039.1 hypothetical protein BGX21_002862 [Mortierella sp. AD011]
MGKKDGMEGGRGSVFSAYLAAMPEPTTGPTDQESVNAAGTDWSRAIVVYKRHRTGCGHLGEKQTLHNQGFASVVSPKLEDKIKLKQDKKKAKKEKKKQKKQEKKLKMEKLSLKDNEGKKEGEGGEERGKKNGSDEATPNEEGLVTIHKSKKREESTSTSEDESSSSSSSDTSTIDSEPELEAYTSKLSASQPPLLKAPGNSALLPGPGRIQPMGNRIRVTAGNGTTYEVDRYCPHKYVDLATKGVVVGNTLFCNKHNWAFALDNNGYCSKHKMTVNACKVDW